MSQAPNRTAAGVTLALACLGGGLGWWADKKFASAAMGAIAGAVVAPAVHAWASAPAVPQEDFPPQAIFQPQVRALPRTVVGPVLRPAAIATQVATVPEAVEVRTQAPVPRNHEVEEPWDRDFESTDFFDDGSRYERVGGVWARRAPAKKSSKKTMAMSSGLPAVPSWTKGSESCGIRVSMGRLEIHNVQAWMDFAPRMQRMALDFGAKTADVVLATVLEVALPQYAWPPAEGSRLREQWDSMVLVLAETLAISPYRDEGKERPRLHLVS